MLYIFKEENTMSIPENLCPIHNEKTLGTMKVMHAVKRITFDRTEASPSETLHVSEPKLNEQQT